METALYVFIVVVALVMGIVAAAVGFLAYFGKPPEGHHEDTTRKGWGSHW